nr:hypothetical protein MFLOJ_29730 [Mycobacterium florentinum]
MRHADRLGARGQHRGDWERVRLARGGEAHVGGHRQIHDRRPGNYARADSDDSDGTPNTRSHSLNSFN